MTSPQRRRRADPTWVVLVGVLVGIAIAAFNQPRAGMLLVSASLGLAAVARLVLRSQDAGSLVVRSRELDVFVLLTLAVAIGLLAEFTPLQSFVG